MNLMQNELGRLLAATRVRHGLSQSNLANLLGVTRSAVSKTESGDRRLTTDELLTLTQLFGDSFELGTEHVMPPLISDLAARLRELLDRIEFEPDAYATRDWLRATLHRLDDTYVYGAA